jgi:hypothetical protein
MLISDQSDFRGSLKFVVLVRRKGGPSLLPSPINVVAPFPV